MKSIFLTSSVGGYVKTEQGKVSVKCNNTNHFIDRLKAHAPQIKTLVFVASNPDAYAISDSYAKLLQGALNLDGFSVENLVVADHRITSNIKEVILSADMLFLAGGHVPTQNAFFKEINLKEILKEFNGVVVGQSAGSINLAEDVYVQPENENEFYDKTFPKVISGLGLTKIKIQPHMNRANIDEIDGTTTFDMCVEDSATIPHYGLYDGGFIEIANGKATAYGKTLLFKDGKCFKLCETGEIVQVNNSYEHGDKEEILSL